MQSEIGRQEKKLMVGGIGLSQEEAERADGVLCPSYFPQCSHIADLT
jgi:hypothetical protein